RLPLHTYGIGISVRRDPSVSCCDNPRWRVQHAWQFFEWDVTRPLVSVCAAVNRQTAVACSANWNFAGCLIRDIAVHTGVHKVLPGCVDLRERLAKLLPVLCRVESEDGISNAIVQSPAQGDLSCFARREITNDRAVARGDHVQCNIRLSFDLDDFPARFRGLPPVRSQILPLRIERYYVCILN